MEELVGYVATGVVMLVVGLLLRELEPKVKVVWWPAHGFTYNLSQLTPPTVLRSDAYTIQNIGRRQAEFIEVVFKSEPDHFSLYPSLNYQTSTTPSGEYVIQVTSLGPKEFYTLQILSYATLPQLLYIRSGAGHARQIPVQWARWYPRWVYWVIGLFTISGFGFLVYWAIQAIYFVLKGVGAVG